MKQFTYAGSQQTFSLLAHPIFITFSSEVNSVKFSLMMNSRTTNHKTGANEWIMIRMKDQTGGEMMFKIKKSTMMSKVFSAYAQRKGVEQASLHFLLNGERISETDTPKMIKLEDEDQIVCVLAQVRHLPNVTLRESGLRHAATTVATGCRLNKYEPKQTSGSSKKTSDVTGPPFKDKSNQSEHNVLPPKSAKMKTKTETKHLVMPEDASKDAEIAKLMAALELREAEVKVKEDKIARMKMAQQADSEEEKGGSYARCPSTPSTSLWGKGSKGERPNMAPIPSTPIFPTPSKPVEDWKPIHKIKLSLSPWRSLSNETIGDPARALLGANGYLLIEENSTHILDEDFVREPGTVRRVSYYNSKVDLMFRAECPRKKFPFHEIQGTAGRDLMFAWDVVNEEHGSGGTTVVGAEGLKYVLAFRRFTFAFTSPALLGVVLYTMFYDSQRFMEEFFKDDGRFTAKEANAPAHKVVKAESAMDIDRPKTRRTVFTAGEFKKKHGIAHDVYGPSQPHF